MRKTLIVIILLQMTFLGAYAQMDDKFYYPSKVWTPIEGLNYDEIRMQADTDTIYSILIHPVGTAKATILYYHGNGGNISQNIEMVRPLVGAGYQVYIIDYRGYGKSTGKPTHQNVADDAERGFADLMQRKDVQSTPILIYGSSLGSQVATRLAKNHNNEIRGLILDSAMASFTDIALVYSPENMHEVIRKHLTAPYAAKEDIKALKDIRLLMIHSKEDQIPFSGAQEIYANANCEKTFWEYKGGHIKASLLYPELLVKYVDGLLK